MSFNPHFNLSSNLKRSISTENFAFSAVKMLFVQWVRKKMRPAIESGSVTQPLQFDVR